MLNDLAAFARRYNVSVVDAYVLPALFERSAQKVNLSARALLAQTTTNRELGEYLAACAHKVAVADRKEAA